MRPGAAPRGATRRGRRGDCLEGTSAHGCVPGRGGGDGALRSRFAAPACGTDWCPGRQQDGANASGTAATPGPSQAQEVEAEVLEETEQVVAVQVVEAVEEDAQKDVAAPAALKETGQPCPGI